MSIEQTFELRGRAKSIGRKPTRLKIVPTGRNQVSFLQLPLMGISTKIVIAWLREIIVPSSTKNNNFIFRRMGSNLPNETA